MIRNNLDDFKTSHSVTFICRLFFAHVRIVVLSVTKSCLAKDAKIFAVFTKFREKMRKFREKIMRKFSDKNNAKISQKK